MKKAEGEGRKAKDIIEKTGMMSLRVLRLCRLPSALLLLLSLSGCRGVQSVLNPAGPQAGRISRLWWLMFYVCSAVFVIVIISVLVAALRSYRKQDDDVSDAQHITPEPQSERRMAGVVTGALLVTGVILFVFLIASFRAGRAIYTLQDPNALSIKVTGHQWWWEVQYEDQTASNIFKTANEIHIPVGRPVRIKLSSTDVIHSFWVPNLDGKKDLLPGGHETIIWFRADREGEFYGQCAEFCGHQHAHMRFVVVAESIDKFNAWLEAQRKPSAQASDEAELRGQQVFLSSPCIMCHTIRGTDAHAIVAPDLTHLASRKTIAAGTLPLTRGHLAGWITNSQEIKPGNRMPPVPLSPEDLQALLSYLGSLK
jgi:cytochrome c oxidase subunit 2